MLLLATAVLLACADPGRSAAGLIVALDAPAGQVTGFTLRTREGATIPFAIGKLEVDGGTFAAAHLAEHAATLEPIVVAYRTEGGVNVAYRLADAPPAAPPS